MPSAQIITAIVSYLLGIMTGLFVKTVAKDKLSGVNSKNIILIVVSIMWTLSVAVEIVNPDYKTSPLIHGLMGSIVGFFYKFEPKK
jgi:hypothetical protein